VSVLVTARVAPAEPTLAHVRSLAETLRTLARAQFVHGDVRAANVLCDSDGRAHLIDFDLGGRAEQRRYVSGFNATVPDGKRHSGARAGNLLRYEHDVYAFARLCKHWGFGDLDAVRELLASSRAPWRGDSSPEGVWATFLAALPADAGASTGPSTSPPPPPFPGSAGSGSPPRE